MQLIINLNIKFIYSQFLLVDSLGLSIMLITFRGLSCLLNIRIIILLSIDQLKGFLYVLILNYYMREKKKFKNERDREHVLEGGSDEVIHTSRGLFGSN
jgi:hypothetical protein